MKVSDERLEGFLDRHVPSWKEVRSLVSEIHKLKNESLPIYGDFDYLVERLASFHAP